MFGKKKPEVLVVGAGPVGLFSALTLAQRGVQVQVVDKEWRTGAHSYALALHPRSLQLFDDAGLLGRILDKAYRVRTIGLFDGAERRSEMRLTDLEEDFSFVAVMRQDLLETLLEEALRDLGVKVQWNHEVAVIAPEEDHVEVTVDKLEKSAFGYGVAHGEWVVANSNTFKVPYVIGADGHRSRVRKALGIDFEEVGPAEHFAVFEFETDADLHHEMRLVMDDETTNVLWPLPDGHCRWSFQIDDDEAIMGPRRKDRFDVPLGTARFPVLSEDSLHELIKARAPWFSARIDEVRWRLVVRFERRLAQNFGKGRMWLAGDAGHMTGPAGIQSMNVGLVEAYELANIIADNLQGTGTPALLEAYNRERLAMWRSLLGLSADLTSGPQTDPWVRDRADRLLPCIPASGDDLAQLLAQVGLSVGKGRAINLEELG